MTKTRKIKKTKKKDSVVIVDNEMINLIKILVIVCAVLLVFYFITVLVNKKDDNNTYSENTTATIQYDKILVGQILNRDEKDYYVLVEKENDQYNSLYNYYLSSYDGENKNFKYYTVDLSDVFNGNHVGEQTVVTGDVANFKFASTTLLRIKNGKATKVYTERDAIVSYLENLK